MFLAPLGLALAFWAWSYFERVDLPGIDTLHYPKEPEGGEIFIRPYIREGTVRVRHLHVAPGAWLRDFEIEWRGFRYEKVSDSRYQAGTFIERNYYFPM